MAKEKIDISADADIARALEKIVALAREYSKIGDAAERVGDKGQKASQTWTESLEGVVGKWVSLNKQIDFAIKAVKLYFDTAKKLREEQVDSTRVIDTGITNYRVAQGNLSAGAGLEAGRRITDIAQQTKSPNDVAFATASMLANYQVGREQAEGPALKAMLELQDVAATQSKIDPGSLARGVLDLLSRSGKSITGENVRSTGAAALGLSRQLRGFDAGELTAAGDLATYGQKAGMGPEETMAIVGMLSESYGESQGKRKFRTLFKDDKFTSDEKTQVAALRTRASGLLRGTDASYAEASTIAGSSMTDEETQAKSAYQASGFTPGIKSSGSIYERLITELRRSQGGVSPLKESVVGTEYAFLNALAYPFTENTGAFATKVISAAHGGTAQGTMDIRVRVLGQDGRDIPQQTDAEGLNSFSNDATQSDNFRP